MLSAILAGKLAELYVFYLFTKCRRTREELGYCGQAHEDAADVDRWSSPESSGLQGSDLLLPGYARQSCSQHSELVLLVWGGSQRRLSGRSALKSQSLSKVCFKGVIWSPISLMLSPFWINFRPFKTMARIRVQNQKSGDETKLFTAIWWPIPMYVQRQVQTCKSVTPVTLAYWCFVAIGNLRQNLLCLHTEDSQPFGDGSILFVRLVGAEIKS